MKYHISIALFFIFCSSQYYGMRIRIQQLGKYPKNKYRSKYPSSLGHHNTHFRRFHDESEKHLLNPIGKPPCKYSISLRYHKIHCRRFYDESEKYESEKYLLNPASSYEPPYKLPTVTSLRGCLLFPDPNGITIEEEKDTMRAINYLREQDPGLVGFFTYHLILNSKAKDKPLLIYFLKHNPELPADDLENVKIIEKYYIKYPSNKNPLFDVPNTILHHAALKKNPDFIEKILARCTPQNKKKYIKRRNSHGNTPLHIATMIGDFECTEELIKFNAPVNAQNRYGETPLLCTIKIPFFKHFFTSDEFGDLVNITHMLLSKNADPTLVDNSNKTALDYVNKLLYLSYQWDKAAKYWNERADEITAYEKIKRQIQKKLITCKK